jgi:hypothetical protein
MQLKLQFFLLAGKRFMPREFPRRRLFTGPNIISLNKNPDIVFTHFCVWFTKVFSLVELSVIKKQNNLDNVIANKKQ